MKDVPLEYWVVETAESRIVLDSVAAAAVKTSILERKPIVEIVDAMGAHLNVIPRDVTLIYHSTPDVRRYARRHGFMLEMENKKDREDYFAEIGEMDPAK